MNILRILIPQKQQSFQKIINVAQPSHFEAVSVGASAAIEQIVVDDCTLDLKSNDTGHVRVPAPYKSVTITQFIKSRVDVIDSPKLRDAEGMTSTDWYELDHSGCAFPRVTANEFKFEVRGTPETDALIYSLLVEWELEDKTFIRSFMLGQ